MLNDEVFILLYVITSITYDDLWIQRRIIVYQRSVNLLRVRLNLMPKKSGFRRQIFFSLFLGKKNNLVVNENLLLHIKMFSFIHTDSIIF